MSAALVGGSYYNKLRGNIRERRPRRAQQDGHEAARRWNEAHAVGTWVDVTLADGKVQTTRTRGQATCFGSGNPAVIFLEGIRGAYALERVRAI